MPTPPCFEIDSKQLAILLGPSKAIGLAIKLVKDKEHYIPLARRLQNIAIVTILIIYNLALR